MCQMQLTEHCIVLFEPLTDIKEKLRIRIKLYKPVVNQLNGILGITCIFALYVYVLIHQLCTCRNSIHNQTCVNSHSD